ncbi:sensor histidine kinase [Sphingobacterium sp. ML3W]|uniref:sensor histidine kinase n=1 Tax=Sphingobacterium sp. ML3W TaxID=1538644 RepID=UPI0009DF0DDC|nr:histidine kinase [Sphingobacterium sp. ML3W]
MTNKFVQYLELVMISSILLLLICCQQKRSGVKEFTNLDSLIERVQKNNHPEKEIPALKRLIDSSLVDSVKLTEAYFYLSYCLHADQQDSASTAAIKKSLDLLPLSEKNGILAATNYYWMGYLEEKKEHYYAATYYYTQAAYLIDAGNLKLSFPKSSAFILYWASELNRHNNRKDLSNKFAKKMLVLVKEDTTVMAKELSVAANLILSMGYVDHTGLANDSVRFYLNQAYQIKEKTKLARINRNYYQVKANVFYESKELDSALFYQLKAQKADTANAFMVYNNLLGIYVEKNQLSKAREAEREVIKRLSQFDADDYLIYLENKIGFAIARGDYKNAQSGFEEYIQKRKEREQNENRKAANEIASVYKMVQKDQEIGSLNENIDHVTTQLKFNRLWLLVIVLFSLLLLITLLLFIFERRRKKILLENRRVSDLNNKLELEQRLLRSQMDPHFIFNCLAGIRALVRQGQNQNTLIYLDHFSVLMREKLTAANERDIDLKSEIGFLENYLKLQQIRLPGKFDYLFELADDVADMTDEIEIPAMLIQPFLENAIVHGFKTITYKGHILISITIHDELLTIVISDNGSGLGNEKKQFNTSRATQIVRERIQILQKTQCEEASFSIRSKDDGQGTVVQLQIPV